MLAQAGRGKGCRITYTVDFDDGHSVAVNGEDKIGITRNRDDTQAITLSLYNVYNSQIRYRSARISALGFTVNQVLLNKVKMVLTKPLMSVESRKALIR